MSAEYGDFVSVRLSPNEMFEVDNLAQQYGSTRSTVIRAALEKMLNEINDMERVRGTGDTTDTEG